MEAAGLLTPALVSANSGYRYYDSANISRIGTILTLKSFGFVNEDIRKHFEHPGDYAALYRKLLGKQRALNLIIDKMNRRLKVTDMSCEIITYHEAYCYVWKVRI